MHSEGKTCSKYRVLDTLTEPCSNLRRACFGICWCFVGLLLLLAGFPPESAGVFMPTHTRRAPQQGSTNPRTFHPIVGCGDRHLRPKPHRGHATIMVLRRSTFEVFLWHRMRQRTCGGGTADFQLTFFCFFRLELGLFGCRPATS